MTLKQLRSLCEIVRQGMHLSHAAAALHTSQPGISRQIHLLEQELDVTILKRNRNRILGLTQPGKEILRFAQRALKNTENIKNIGQEFKNETTGGLVVATTYTYARYVLPRVIPRFSRKFPYVRLEFWQGSPQRVLQLVGSGEADLAVVTNSDANPKDVVLLPFGKFHRSVITLPKHPLLKGGKLTLDAIAKYPIITYGFEASGWGKFNHVFESKGLKPNIVFRAVDAEISKKYVELGLGIAIVPHIAYDPARDKTLRAIDASHLFDHSTMYIGINREQFLRKYVFEFIEMLAPQLTRAHVERTMECLEGSSASAVVG